jgi:hypothetical protein
MLYKTSDIEGFIRKTSANENDARFKTHVTIVPSSRWKLLSEIHKLINCIWSNKEWPQQWKETNLIMKRMIRLNIIITQEYHGSQPINN